MIISRTPHRISLFGGGSDYPVWYLEHGGKVVGGTIDKYCYITCRELPPFFEHRHRIVYSKVETVKALEEIQHPSVRETLKYFTDELRLINKGNGLEIHHDGDIPARSGMGSSSSFTVGLVKALMAFVGKMVTKEDIYKTALHIEQELIRENVGSQDQVWAAMGGMNKIEFSPNGVISVSPIIISESRIKSLESRLMLFFSGVSRYASNIAEDKMKNLPQRQSEIFRMMELVEEACSILTASSDNLGDLGRLLHEAWLLKKRLSTRISSSFLDNIYETALKNGATGGKLLGAGGGGFLLFYVEPERQLAVKEALKGFLPVPFKFEFSGAEIVFDDNRY